MDTNLTIVAIIVPADFPALNTGKASAGRFSLRLISHYDIFSP